MSNISTILLLLTAISAALVIVNWINQRQIRQRLLTQQLVKLKQRVTELEDLLAIIEPLVENKKIPQVVNDEIIALLQDMLKISPDNNVHSITLENALARAEDLRDPTRASEVFRLMESDATLAKAHYIICETARIVRRQQAKNKLQAAEMDMLLTELLWADFMVKICSHVGQGHKALANGDRLRASAFYKKALEIASTEMQRDERQNQVISELGELLNYKRSALSTNIMPETIYNPEPSKKAQNE